MPKIDSLKEKINILRDDYRNMFIFFMAVLTGSFTVFFQVVVGKISILYTFIGIVGVVVSLFTLLKMKRIKFDIDLLIEELGELDE
ncbi:MAG: hypothetical protein U9N59_14325 [Campylobacterota bacterium]|nr:hypothetical protein [Campylobacterota bacterium]